MAFSPFMNRKQEKSLVLPRRWGKLSPWQIPMTHSLIMDLVEMKSLFGQDIEQIR